MSGTRTPMSGTRTPTRTPPIRSPLHTPQASFHTPLFAQTLRPIPAQTPKRSPNKLVTEFYAEHRSKPAEEVAVSFAPLDQNISSDPELTNYLLNIDTIVKDLYGSDDSESEAEAEESTMVAKETTTIDSSAAKKLEPLYKTLQSVNQMLAHHEFHRDAVRDAPPAARDSQALALALALVRDSLQAPRDPWRDSPRELPQLFARLSTMKLTITEIQNQISTTTKRLRTTVRPEITASGTRLMDLMALVENLERRLDRIRGTVRENKAVSHYDSLEVLEYVDRRMAQYNKETNKARFKQLNVFVAVAIVAAAVWWWRWRQ